MKLAIQSQPVLASKPGATSTAPASPDVVQSSPADGFKPSDKPASYLKNIAIGAAYGAAVGTASGFAYQQLGDINATMVHMGGILAGGAAGSLVLGKAMAPKVEVPANYALGALAGAGVTWGTSAFGLLHNPMLAGVTGAAVGGIYGALATLIFNFKPPSSQPPSSPLTQTPAAPAPPAPAQPAPPSEKLPDGMWKGMAGAYTLAGGVLGVAVAAKVLSGHCSAGVACGGAAIAGLALVNGYLTAKWNH